MKRTRIFKLTLFLLYAILSFTACADSISYTETSNMSMENITDEMLQIHYIDVGQGDATLVVCDGQTMLIDAGENDKGTTIQMYLKSRNIESLDYVIGTHPDSDHIGGLDVILTKFDCKNIFLTEEEKDTDTYRDVVDAMRYKSYKKTFPKVGDQYTLGTARFTIVGPVNYYDDSNENSIAIVLEHGKNRFYFEGDASEKEEADILSTGIDIQADVYKVGHHGSKFSSGDELLEAINPAYAVISVGEGNRYGHPTAEVLNKLRANKVQVFRTDEQGTIVAVSDGDSIAWNCSPSESWQAGEQGGSDVSQKPQEKEQMVNVTEEQGDIVHITKNGKKYHAQGCEHLKSSDIEITLTDAKNEGYTPCLKCKPVE